MRDIVELAGPSAPKARLGEGAVLGKYRILRSLGAGAWGSVFEAEDTILERRVALKVLEPQPMSSPQEHKPEERFLREARLAVRLPRHPHIVAVYDADILEGRHFIAMELAEGKPMDVWRRCAGPRRQIRLVAQIALAVHHAHEHGVLHRDLKPANVLVDGQDAPHVMDFGLAKSLRGTEVSLTDRGFVIGTPHYMSPEQARGERDLDPRSDVWALGVMLYEILAGSPPFDGLSPMETLLRTIQEPVRPPSVRAGECLLPAVDPRIESICLQALQKERPLRHKTARALGEAIQEWLDQSEAESRGGIARWLRRFMRRQA